MQLYAARAVVVQHPAVDVRPRAQRRAARIGRTGHTHTNQIGGASSTHHSPRSSARTAEPAPRSRASRRRRPRGVAGRAAGRRFRTGRGLLRDARQARVARQGRRRVERAQPRRARAAARGAQGRPTSPPCSPRCSYRPPLAATAHGLATAPMEARRRAAPRGWNVPARSARAARRRDGLRAGREPEAAAVAAVGRGRPT